MIKKWACAFFLTCCVIASAKAEQGCAYVSAIRFAEETYQFNNAESLWETAKVKERDFIDRFIGAIFFPDKDQEGKYGHVECAYLTGSGRRVTFNYMKHTARESMSLISNMYWKSAVDPLGQPVYICQDSQPDNCKFTLESATP